MLISEKSQGIFQTRALGCFFIVKELYHIFLTHLKMPRGQMLTQRLKPKFFWTEHLQKEIKKKTSKELDLRGEENMTTKISKVFEQKFASFGL